MRRFAFISCFILGPALSIAHAEESAQAAPTSEATMESSVSESSPYRSANLVLEYTDMGLIGLDAGIGSQLSFGLRTGSSDLTRSTRYDFAGGNKPAKADMMLLGAELTWYATGARFMDSLTLTGRVYSLSLDADAGTKVVWKSKVLTNEQSIYGTQAIAGYKWFSERLHINGGPGVAYDITRGFLALHLSLGVTF